VKNTSVLSVLNIDQKTNYRESARSENNIHEGKRPIGLAHLCCSPHENWPCSDKEEAIKRTDRPSRRLNCQQKKEEPDFTVADQWTVKRRKTDTKRPSKEKRGNEELYRKHYGPGIRNEDRKVGAFKRLSNLTEEGEIGQAGHQGL